MRSATVATPLSVVVSEPGAAAGVPCGVTVTVALGMMPAPPSPNPMPSPGGAKPCGTASGPANLQHVVWIWMENRDYSEVIGSSAAPYENQLATQCGVATNYTAVATPSLPNYIAAVSGS